MIRSLEQEKVRHAAIEAQVRANYEVGAVLGEGTSLASRGRGVGVVAAWAASARSAWHTCLREQTLLARVLSSQLGLHIKHCIIRNLCI